MLNMETIRSLELFESFNDQELGGIFGIAKETDYAAGAVIIREGSPGGMLHVIVEGQVEVRKKAVGGEEKPLASLGGGTVFGEMSLFDSYPYSASVIAMAATRTLSMFRNDFLTMAETQPALAFKVTVNLLNILSRKLRKTNENLVTLAMLRSE